MHYSPSNSAQHQLSHSTHSNVCEIILNYTHLESLIENASSIIMGFAIFTLPLLAAAALHGHGKIHKRGHAVAHRAIATEVVIVTEIITVTVKDDIASATPSSALTLSTTPSSAAAIKLTSSSSASVQLLIPR